MRKCICGHYAECHHESSEHWICFEWLCSCTNYREREIEIVVRNN